MIEEKTYSAAEVAEMFDVVTKTVARWIEAGFLPGSVKKGPYPNSPYKIPHSAVEYLRQHTGNSEES